MRKNKMIMAFAMTTALALGGLTSCSEDVLNDLNGGSGFVTFTATLEDETDTRALGDGASAKRLYYAVYDKDGKFVDGKNVTVTNKQASVDLQLVSGQAYDIAFFAYNSSSPSFNPDGENHVVKVDYSKINGSSSSSVYDHDCFYEVRRGYVAGSSSQENVTLRRPVAQVNFATDDLEAAVVTNTFGATSSIYAYIETTASTSFDLLSGEVSEKENVKLPVKRCSKYGDFTIPGYKYLASGYLFVEDPAEVRDITLKVQKGSNTSASPLITVNVPNAPVKRNYRTNVYGSLLTATSNWKVEIEPIFSGNTDVWVGNSENPVQNEDGSYSINTPAQLAGLAKMVNGGDNFAGKTVYLNADINLNNLNWTPIGTPDAPFNGIFEGNGHTISDLKVELGKTSVPAGLFGAVKYNGEIRNFTIDGAELNVLAATPAKYGTGAAAGWLYTAKCADNVTVKNVNIEAYRYAGGVVGKGYTSITNCTAENVVINMHFENVGKKADGSIDWYNCDKAGGILGQQDEGSYSLTGNRCSNIRILGYRHIGSMFGHINYGNKTVTDNEVNGALLTQTFSQNYNNIKAGDLVGEIWGALITENEGVTYNPTLSKNVANSVEIMVPSSITSVETLIQAAQQGGYVSLDASLDLSSVDGTITISKPTVLDLKGNTLKVKDHAINVVSELNITGDDGEITSDGYTICGEKGSIITISGGVVSSTATSGRAQAVNTNGDFIMTGGKVVGGPGIAVTLNWATVSPCYDYYEASISGGEIVGGKSDYALRISAPASGVKSHVEIDGGTFVGVCGAYISGNVSVDIKDGCFIQLGNAAGVTGHAICAGATGSDQGTVLNISGGYFYGQYGYAICNSNATTIVSGGYINKTGGGFEYASGASLFTLDKPVTYTYEGNTYSFGYQVK